jgi:hypothetical protein
MAIRAQVKQNSITGAFLGILHLDDESYEIDLQAQDLEEAKAELAEEIRKSINGGKATLVGIFDSNTPLSMGVVGDA